MSAVDPRRWPWWAQTLGVYAAARLFSALALLVVAGHQVANGWTAEHPSYSEYTGLMWDATWYRQIAEGGYPDTLPVGTDGQVVQNAWAFFPLFPLLARMLMSLTGASWAVVAPTLALVLGAAAVVVIHRVIAVGAPRAVAARPGLPLATVLLVSVFPTSAVMQVGYTESLALLLIALSLWAIITRHYGWAVLAVLALGFTRAVALPMAAVVLVHAWSRWRERRSLPPRTWAALAGVAVAAGVSGVVWMLICGAVTGVPDAYLQTQAAWRGSADIAPFGAWGYILPFWFGDAWALVGLGIVLLAFVVLLAPSTRRLGGELYTWGAAYPLYLCAAIEPGSSLARFLLLAFPLGAATVGVLPRPRWAARVWTGLLVVVMLGLQLVWLWQIWRFVPPSGWPP